MSIMTGQQLWPPSSGHQINGNKTTHDLDDALQRIQTPIDNSHSQALMPEASTDQDDDRRDRQRAYLNDIYQRTESRISQIFGDDGDYNYAGIDGLRQTETPVLPATTDHAPVKEPPRKKVKRVIDEDDYGDDDDDEEDEEDATGDTSGTADASAADISPLKHKSSSAGALLSPSKSGSSPVQSVPSPDKSLEKSGNNSSTTSQTSLSQTQPKTAEDARKRAEEDRVAREEGARRSFFTLFHTLEHDRNAMLDQQQLEDSEKQLQAEMDKNGGPGNTSVQPGENHGSLSSANLGASSLTLKHLIARIDLKRDMVRASDAELRSLINEVRKNRSKWASEENVNQEELYEAVEKVLTELKAHTEYSTPFLQRVNKRDAPDYYNRKPWDFFYTIMWLPTDPLIPSD
jgi:transcriptional activator SPT7